MVPRACLEGKCFFYNSAYYPLKEAAGQIEALKGSLIEALDRGGFFLVGGGGGFWILEIARVLSHIRGKRKESEPSEEPVVHSRPVIVWAEYSPFVSIFRQNAEIFRALYGIDLRDYFQLMLLELPAENAGNDEWFLDVDGVSALVSRGFDALLAEISKVRLEHFEVFLHPVANKLKEAYKPVASAISSKVHRVFSAGTASRLSSRLQIARRYAGTRLLEHLKNRTKLPGSRLIEKFTSSRHGYGVVVAAGPSVDVFYNRYSKPSSHFGYASSGWASCELSFDTFSVSSNPLTSCLTRGESLKDLFSHADSAFRRADFFLIADVAAPSFFYFLRENYREVYLDPEVPKYVFGVDPQEVSYLSKEYMDSLLLNRGDKLHQAGKPGGLSFVATTSSHPLFQEISDYIFSSNLTPELDDLLGKIPEVGFVGGFMLMFLRTVAFSGRLFIVGFDFAYPWLVSHSWGYPFEGVWMWMSNIRFGLQSFKRSPVFREETFKNYLGYFTEPRLEFFRERFEEVLGI